MEKKKTVDYTPAQRAAMNTDGHDLLVSAAAGSGKTFVLVKRIVRLIRENKASIDRMAVVTFTKAAAAELKGRLAKALSDLAAGKDGDENAPAKPDARLLRQSYRVHSAQISTIHSFCFDLLREYKKEAGLSGVLRIAEEAESQTLLQESVEEALERALSDPALIPGFSALYDLFSGARSDSRIAEMVVRALNVCDSYPGRTDFLIRKLNEVEKDRDAILAGKNEADVRAGAVLAQNAVSAAAAAKARAEQIVSALHRSVSIAPLYGEAIEKHLALLQRAVAHFQNGAFQEGLDAMREAAEIALPSANSSAGKKVLPEERDLRGAMKSEFDSIQKTLAEPLSHLRFSREEVLRDYADHLSTCRPFFDLVKLSDEIYTAKKREKELLDFADLEHLSWRLLVQKDETGAVRPTPIGEEVASHYDAIFVDEYQDTNFVQDEIFQAITCKRNDLFIVGDPKQSVYRFRGAVPSIFTDRKNSWKLLDPARPNEPAKILLSDNFRCDAGVIDLVNSLFRVLMDSQKPGSLYGPEDELHCSKIKEEQMTEKSELILVGKKFAPFFDEEEDGNDENTEASVIADEIRRILDGKILKKDGTRYKASDIAVLSQTHAPFAKLKKSLALRGILCSDEENDTILSEPETLFAASLLAILENPLDDVALIGVLSSPVFCFTPDDLYGIRKAFPEGRFFTALCRLSEDKESLYAPKAAAFLKKFYVLAEKSKALPLQELIWECYEALSVREAFLSSGKKSDALLYLMDAAKSFEASSLRSIPDFLDYLQKNCASYAEDGGGERVNLETMHHSKGLEYPIVFCSFLGTSFTLMDKDQKKPYLFSDRFGFVPAVAREDGALRWATVLYQAAKEEYRRELLEEKKRLFYVSLTRAKTKLYLTGSSRSGLGTLQKKFFLDREEPLPVEVTRDLVGRCDSLLEFFFAASHENALFRRALAAAVEQDDPKNGSFAEEAGEFEEGLFSVSFRGARPAPEKDDAAEEEDSFEGFDPEKLRAALEFTYEDDGRMDLPKKLTVSQIVAQNREEEEDLQPRTLLEFQNGKLRSSAAFIGTSMHEVMQFADLQKAAEDLDAEIDRLYRDGFLTKEAVECLDRKKLAAFFESPLYERMKKSPALVHEKRFNVLLDGEKWIGKPGEILVQGVVDAYFEKEDGTLCVTDFKTDRVRGKEGEALLCGRHGEQLRLYADALEKITGKEVTELLLYSFSLGRAVPVER